MLIIKIILIVLLFSVFSIVAFIYLAPKKVTQLALNSERRRSGLKSKKIDLASKLIISYLEGGEGEPLVLLHGFGGNKDTFVRVAGYLTKTYKVIIPDIVGFGESSHPVEADYSPQEQAHRIREFTKALGINSLHLGGNSMGAQIAILYAANYPSDVNSLWLLSPSGIWSAPKSDVLKEIIETENNPLIARDLSEYKKVMALGMSKVPFIPKPMLKILAQERILNSSLEKKIFKQLLDCSLEGLIEGLYIKTLIVFGEEDRVLTLETADILNRLLPVSVKKRVLNVGHVQCLKTL